MKQGNIRKQQKCFLVSGVVPLLLFTFFLVSFLFIFLFLFWNYEERLLNFFSVSHCFGNFFFFSFCLFFFFNTFSDNFLPVWEPYKQVHLSSSKPKPCCHSCSTKLRLGLEAERGSLSRVHSDNDNIDDGRVTPKMPLCLLKGARPENTGTVISNEEQANTYRDWHLGICFWLWTPRVASPSGWSCDSGTIRSVFAAEKERKRLRWEREESVSLKGLATPSACILRCNFYTWPFLIMWPLVSQCIATCFVELQTQRYTLPQCKTRSLGVAPRLGRRTVGRWAMVASADIWTLRQFSKRLAL